MKVIKEKVVDESDAFDDTGSDDTPPPVMQKKSVKVRVKYIFIWLYEVLN